MNLDDLIYVKVDKKTETDGHLFVPKRNKDGLKGYIDIL